ncbi:MAG: methylenetetrahydrofolate reductase C-terminal domain-containing protein [Deltaproteobacteria bacterium]|nr:methylenetetrahydrofolate reductase C-terminal domain-containing protein [Deltaproteobacteria bacterium]
MIIAERKPFKEIAAAVAPYDKILIVGCGTCVAVCLAGGEKEVGLLASQLKLAAGLKHRRIEVGEITVERQCDLEFLEPLCDFVADFDAIISMACGAGVQFLAHMCHFKPIFPAVDTTFIGVNNAVGYYTERCRACRRCYLGLTGGICPVTMCPKGLLNGPCGGTLNGKCEVDLQKDCAWSKIYQRLELEGRLDNLKEIVPLHPHSRGTTPGTVIHPAYRRRYGVDE